MPELSLEDKEMLPQKVGTGQGRGSRRVWGHRSVLDTGRGPSSRTANQLRKELYS